METLKAAFGLEGQDLNLDLGPLGKLLDDPQRLDATDPSGPLAIDRHPERGMA